MQLMNIWLFLILHCFTVLFDFD